MNKIVHVFLKLILSLIIITPLFGVLGVFPEPTREMYGSDEAFNFISVLMNNANYIQYTMAFVFLLSIFFLWTRREALAAALLLPITINIVFFHLFLDGGLLTGGAVLGNILLILNIYFMWINKERYNSLFKKN